MSDAIDRAARALWDYDNADSSAEWRDMAWDDMGGSEPSEERVEYELRARALHAAGLIAPAPLREEPRSEHTVRAAEVLIDHPSIPNYSGKPEGRDYVCPRCPDALVYGPNSPDHAVHQAEMLAEAGLLAPAPLREEWGIRWDDGVWECYRNRAEAEVGAGDEGTPVHRYVSDWMPADPAEGDGRDEREPTVPASQLRAFARLCADGGDMTPAAARILDRIIDGDGRAEK